MSANKSARNKLIAKFGRVCFIEELGLRTKSEIKADLKRYKGKKQRARMDILTFHHIVERCNGGETTEANGALLRNINHIWLHRLPPEKQAIINRLLLEYKKLHYTEIQVELVEELKTEVKAAATTFKPKELFRDKNELAKIRQTYQDR